MRRLVLSVLTSAIVLLATASAALAVPLHQHELTSPSGNAVQIAKGICKNDLQRAIDNLHMNVHLGTPGQQAWANNGVSLAVVPCP